MAEQKVLSICIEDIRPDGNTQVRARIDDERVQHYAERILAGDKFPPIVVFDDGNKDHGYWMADGFHRVAAAKIAKKKTCGAIVYKGTREDALWFACAANKSSGLHMSNADKRRAAELTIQAFPGKSAPSIADQIGVSHTFVSAVRAEMEKSGQVATVATSTGKDGKVYPRPTEADTKGNDEKPADTPTPETEESQPEDSGKTYDEPAPTEPPPGEAPKREVPTDQVGQPIPDDPALRDAFARRIELERIGRQARDVWSKIKNLGDHKDPLISFVPFTATQTQANNLAHSITAAAPYAVCPYCQGGAAGRKQRQDCRACKGLGWVTKSLYDNAPEAMKKGVRK